MQLLQENFPPPVLKIALSGRSGGFGQNFNLVWSAQHDGEWHASGEDNLAATFSLVRASNILFCKKIKKCLRQTNISAIDKP